MGVMASQITSLMIVDSTFIQVQIQENTQMLPFDDVIML